MEQPIVSAVTSDVSEAKVTITGVPDRPGVAAAIFRGLADRAVNVDMIVQISAQYRRHRHLLHGATLRARQGAHSRRGGGRGPRCGWRRR